MISLSSPSHQSYLAIIIIFITSLSISACGGKGTTQEATDQYPQDKALVSDGDWEESQEQATSTPNNNAELSPFYHSTLSITHQPQDYIGFLNTDASFTITASSRSPLTYQWLKNREAITGETNAILTLPNLRESDAGEYQVIVYDKKSHKTSQIASLNLLGKPTIDTQPKSLTVYEGDSASIFTSSNTQGNIRYQWFHNDHPIAGATSNTLSTSRALLAHAGKYFCAVSNEAGTSYTRLVEFVVSSRETTQHTLSTTVSDGGVIQSNISGIDCGIDCEETLDDNIPISLVATADQGFKFSGWSGSCSGTESCDLIMSKDHVVTATFSQYLAPTILSQPSDLTINQGVDASFTTSATGNGTLSYQWYKDDKALAGATSDTLFIAQVDSSHAGSYFCAVSNFVGSSYTHFAELTVSSIELVQHKLSTEISGSGVIQSTISGIDCGIDCEETFDENSPVSLIATANQGYAFSGWSGSCSGAADCNLLMTKDHTVTATFTQYLAPTILSQPSDLLINEGLDASFSTAATGNGTLSYQWYKDELVLSGATASSLNLIETTSADEGLYFCEVTNEAGSVISNSAELVIIAAPIPQHRLTTSLSGGGVIQSDIDGITCGTDCTEMFNQFTPLSLTAIADPGYQFSGWSDSCSGTDNCDLVMDTEKLVTATFTPIGSTENVTLQWTEPSLYDDGALLPQTEIAFYEILWGRNSSNLELLAQITNRDTHQYVVENLGLGEHYFSISVTTIHGTKSNQSNIITKIIN